MKIKDLPEKAEILKNKKVQWGIVIAVLLLIIILGSSIRLSNLPLLKDSTTGEYIPLALDPFYFLRVAQTILDTSGNLPPIDNMRSPSRGIGWHKEILPETIVMIYNLAKTFDPSIALDYVGIITPVILFIIGLVVFFFFVYFLSNSMVVAVLASTILALSPSYLYRTMAGFTDHDVYGMLAVFSFLLVYALALKNFEKSWGHTICYSLLSGFMIAFILATWGGAVTFVLLVMPIAFGLYWLLSKKDCLKSISFYVFFLLSTVLSPIVFGFSAMDMIRKASGSYGILVPGVFLFIIIDFFLESSNKVKVIEKRRIFYSIISTLVVGFLGLQLIGKNILLIFRDVWWKLFNPFSAGGRLGRTVAENAQPYLLDWINQSGKIVFWLFFIGILIVGWELFKNLKDKKDRIWLFSSWVVMFSAVLFSRISSKSFLNGDNFFSKAVYLLGLLFFVGVFLWKYSEWKFKANPLIIIFSSILLVTVVYGRSASRIFFLVAPFVSLSAAFAIWRIYNYAKESKEKILKTILWAFFTIALIGLLFSLNTSYKSISSQARYTGPSAHIQWQKAMKWVRENTPPNSIFVHWWDYGYWIQSLGKRPTVTDGGHSGGFQTDHYIGRYVLTTPNPESALSYMKTWNVSYLLIDPTDLGKYGAYSSIGGGEKDPNDRLAAIPIMVLDPRQSRETKNGTINVYVGGSILFEDILFEKDGKKIFIPSGGHAGIGGIVIKTYRDGNSTKFGQPEGVYIYNGRQYQIPLRFLYVGGNLVDFGFGINATARIIPYFDGQKVIPTGSVIYLSQKVTRGLFAQLYLMDDPFERYPTLKLVHSQDDIVVEQLRNAGYSGEGFIYYRGFRGPIKIWKVSYPNGTKVYPKFKEPLETESDGTLKYAMFDEVFYGRQE